MGVDVSLTTPTYSSTYRRKPVGTDFCQRFRQFLWNAASDFTPQHLAPFEDGFAGMSIRVLDSSDLTVTLEVQVVTDEDEGGDDVDGLNFETSRAALITASEDAVGLAVRVDPEEARRMTEPALPLDLLHRPESHRLTGIYRMGRGIRGKDLVTMNHLIYFPEVSDGALETSVLTSVLPSSSVAAHGVDHQRRPWAIVTQVLPQNAETHVAAPWNAVQVAREEINHAVRQIQEATISGETIATQSQLIDLFQIRGVPRSLIDDWSVEDLALTGIAELTNAGILNIVRGRITGCAFPDVPHDCPKDVLDCTFQRWQEMLFNSEST